MGAGALVATVATLALAGAAQAATFTVNSVGDASDATLDGTCATAGAVCTLRAAIEEPNDTAAADTVTFSAPSPSTINLASALPGIDEDLTITGPGKSALTVRRDVVAPFRVFTTLADVTISGMTITNGLDDATAIGGGISSTGGLSISSSTISSNTASATSTTDNATATGGGVGIAIGGGSFTNVTITGNHALATDATPGGRGGGVGVLGGVVRITSSTIASNEAAAGANIVTRFSSMGSSAPARPSVTPPS